MRARLAREQYENSREEREADDRVAEAVMREESGNSVADIIRRTYEAAGVPVPDSLIAGLDRGGAYSQAGADLFFNERMGGFQLCAHAHRAHCGPVCRRSTGRGKQYQYTNR